MPGERGEYRPIYVVLLDGPDFQALAAEERWVLVALKLSLGMLGIAVLPGLEAALAERTGLPARRVSRALATLDQHWIHREKNVVWLTRGFEFEPNMSPSNQMHRTSVQRQVGTLPSLPIVEQFRQTYAEWFDAPYTNGSRQPVNRLSTPPLITETETEPEPIPEPRTTTTGRVSEKKRWEQLAAAMDETGRSALEGYRKASREPSRLLGELEAIVSGSHGPGGKPVPAKLIGNALHDMALVGVELTARRLRAFVKGALEPEQPARGANGKDPEDEYERTARRLEAQERNHAS